MTVPYIFANQTGPIPLNYLDANFAAVPDYANSAGTANTASTVTSNEQANITAVGVLTGLSVSGNVTGGNLAIGAITGSSILVTGNAISGNLSTSGYANITADVNAGNVLTPGVVSSTGNVTGGNLRTAGLVTATGNITGGNLLTSGLVSATSTITSSANITGGNLLTSGLVSATSTITSSANITGGNLLTGGIVSATGNVSGNYFLGNGSQLTGVQATGIGTLAYLSVTGNIDTGNLNSANNVNITGNLLVSGNATIQGNTTFIDAQSLNITDKNITVANGVSTSSGIDGAGIDAGNPTVAYIRYSHASNAWTTANNFSVGGNVAVTGIVTASTAANGTNNTQLATTAFVNTAIGNYAPAKDGTGATGTWGISISGNASSATTAGSATTFTSTSQNSQFNSVGVGTAASTTAGEIRATNNITAYYSDDRLKTHLGRIENALDKVCELEGFYYEANETAQALGYKVQREVGLSAQATQKSMPEIVAPAPIDEQYLTIRYEKYAPYLVEAIKELRAEIEELKRRL
jgi:hypothetical protein